MKDMTITRKLLWLLLFPFLFCSCEDKMDEHYEVPVWVKGSVWELLSAEDMNGQYSMFLEAIELSGYRGIVDGKSLMTVMAPDNEAMTKYLQKHSYASVKDVPADELKRMVGYHLLYYSYNKGWMEDFRPEGEGAYDEGAEILDPGMYYKFRTRSQDGLTQEVDPATGRLVNVYHFERLMPVFSHNFFRSKKIDAKKNYEYFYQDSEWKGDQGFNVAEAVVKEYALPANNGYVYTVDRVIEPVGTIYDEMKNEDDYSDFLTIYNQFSAYVKDLELTEQYAANLGVDTLFIHYHNEPLAPIAMEWPVPNYQRLDTLAYKSYSVFAPTNQALDDFFNSYWKGSGYSSFVDLDKKIQEVFLNEFVYGGSVAFPEEIENGLITSASGTAYSFNPWNVNYRKMCVNGSFYGLDEIETPVLFNSVVGASISDKNHLYFLYALEGSNLLYSYVRGNSKYTLLVPENEDFQYHDPAIETTYDPVTGELKLQMMGDEGELVDVSSAIWTSIANMHTAVGEFDLPKRGTKVIPSIIPFNYWFVKDGKITCSNYFNYYLDPNTTQDQKDAMFVAFEEVTNDGKPWDNGKTYTYKSGGATGFGVFDYASGSSVQYLLANNSMKEYPYYMYAQLLKKADMVYQAFIRPWIGKRAIAFIPTNKAIIEGLKAGKIPGAGNITPENIGDAEVKAEDPAALAAYLNKYVIDGGSVAVAPYPGSSMASGDYPTIDGKATIHYTDNGTSLSVRATNGQECLVDGQYWYFPFSYSDGCFHLITSLLY